MDKIFGKSWDEIQAMQQGRHEYKKITGKPIYPMATDKDVELLEKHGMDGLTKLGYFGVLDRLSRR